MQSNLMQWFEGTAGQGLLQQEAEAIRPYLAKSLADVCLQVGGCPSPSLVAGCSARWVYCVGDALLNYEEMPCIYGDMQYLPIKPGTIDAIILPHTFDVMAPNTSFLSQICRLLTPSGDLFVLYFNPYGLCHQAMFFGIHPVCMPKLVKHKPSRWQYQLKSLGLVPLFQDTLPCYWPGLDEEGWLKYLLDKGAWSSLGCVRLAHWRKSQWCGQWVGRKPIKPMLRTASMVGSLHNLTTIF